MNDTYATVDVVKQRLDKQLFEAFTDSDILIDCSDSFNDLAHYVIFVSQKWSKKSKTMPLQCNFSSELIFNVEENPLICPDFLLRMAIEDDHNDIKYRKLRALCRNVFSITKSFCKQYNLPLILVPFEVVYSDSKNAFVVTQVPQFENLRFADLTKYSKYKSIDEFYTSQVNLLNSFIHSMKSSTFWNPSISAESDSTNVSIESDSSVVSTDLDSSTDSTDTLNTET